jgi:predicted peroxiredoxin
LVAARARTPGAQPWQFPDRFDELCDEHACRRPPARMDPLDPPVQHMVESFLAGGGTILVCPPCARVRGYEDEDLIDGVEVVGSPAIHALIKEGAATMSF